LKNANEIIHQKIGGFIYFYIHRIHISNQAIRSMSLNR